MIETPSIVQSTSVPTAVIHLTVPASDIRNVMGPGLQELTAAIKAQGSTPAGPWFTYHFKRPAEVFDFEISMAVSAPVVAAGRVKPSRSPARRVARTVYHGSYEGLAGAWSELIAWVEKNGHTSAPELWECYVKGPESSSNPADWRTELNCPLL